MKEQIKNKANLNKVVQDPSCHFFKFLKDSIFKCVLLLLFLLDSNVYMKLQTEEFLNKNKLDTSIIKKAKDNTVELQDLPALRRGLDILNGFQTHPV